MTLLKLFLSFLEVGAVSFGGGYAMIPLIRDICLSNGWMTEEELINFIAVAESTPGPIAVNMATFVGSSQGGVPGAVCATLGVILPSFVIILLIAALITGLMRYAGVQAFLSGVRPAVVGLILATGLTMGLSVLCGIKTVTGDTPAVLDWRAPVIFVLLWGVHFAWKKLRGCKPSPILMIILAAALGIGLYGFIGNPV